jgi:acyl-coenzyme A thioesterase PaaI-like protein
VRWTFGAEPLPQTERAAALLRRVTGLLQSLEQEQPEVERLIVALIEAEDELTGLVPPDPGPRVGEAVSGEGRVYLDHARDIGSFNPCFPEYGIEVNGDQAWGSVTFPLAYEGPPGIVHGGFLAVFFDCVAQHHNCEVGTAGKTTSLTLGYRRPVPLGTELSFTLERSVAEGKIHSAAALRHGERLLCEAEVDAVAGDRANLPEVSPRRKRP